ncbi:hypothetical protein Bca4012_038759 [Brassica carinata]
MQVAIAYMWLTENILQGIFSSKGLALVKEWSWSNQRKVLKNKPLPDLLRARARQHGGEYRCICHTDAAWDKLKRHAGLAWIFSGPNAKEPRSNSTSMGFVSSPLMAEVLALRSALLTAATLGYKQLKLASDNLTLIRAINGNMRTKEIFGVLQDIQQISSAFTDIIFSFVPRKLNQEVEQLAKRALAQSSFSVHPPLF